MAIAKDTCSGIAKLPFFLFWGAGQSFFSQSVIIFGFRQSNVIHLSKHFFTVLIGQLSSFRVTTTMNLVKNRPMGHLPPTRIECHNHSADKSGHPWQCNLIVFLVP